MLLEEYIQIGKEEFPYLFEQYKFNIVYTNEGKGRDIGRYAFGIESPAFKAKMLFSRQQHGGMIYFGTASAPFLNEYSHLWIADGNLFLYLEQQPVDWSELDKYEGESMIRPRFSLTSNLLKVHCAEIFEMFSSEEKIAAWFPKYEEYIKQIVFDYKKAHRNINL